MSLKLNWQGMPDMSHAETPLCTLYVRYSTRDNKDFFYYAIKGKPSESNYDTPEAAQQAAEDAYFSLCLKALEEHGRCPGCSSQRPSHCENDE